MFFPGHIGNVDIKRTIWARFASVFWLILLFFFYFFLLYLCLFFILYCCVFFFVFFCAAIWRNKEWRYCPVPNLWTRYSESEWTNLLPIDTGGPRTVSFGGQEVTRRRIYIWTETSFGRVAHLHLTSKVTNTGHQKQYQVGYRCGEVLILSTHILFFADNWKHICLI